MYYVQHSKAYGHYLYEYQPKDGKLLMKLKWAWTLDRTVATKYDTEEKAREAINRFDIPFYIIRKWS